MKPNIINVEQFEYWNDKSGPKWVKLDDSMNERFSILTDELFRRANMNKNDYVLDIGCGGGQTAFRASQLVGNAGYVLGADISETLLNLARNKYSKIDNLEFNLCDVQNHNFQSDCFDKIISRFGVMFFDDPVAAFRNIRPSLKSDGSLHFVCWTEITQNEFIVDGAEIIAQHTQISLPPVTKKPGPFAFSEKSYVEEILAASGFKNIKIDTVHTTISTKDSLQQAADILMNIGPRAKMLTGADLSHETLLQIKSEIIELCKRRRTGNEIKHKACLNYVSAVK
jgi:ubiquinone/menaquinone biosynthesis C-methylase UbiE